MSTHRVFVYGTLMRGQPNHRVMEEAGGMFLREATTRDEYLMADLGWFPGVIPVPGGAWSPEGPRRREEVAPVRGEVYMVDDRGLARLDRLEGHPFHYERVMTDLTAGEGEPAWMYVYRRGVDDDATYVAGGWWIAHNEAKLAAAEAEEKRRARAVASLADLCDLFGADAPAGLNRRIYKDTSCGASISLYLPDGTALHNGAEGWNTLTRESPIRGFTIQTIVEGSDATVDSDEFVLPVTVGEVEDFVEYMEGEAAFLWTEANEDESEVQA